MSEVHHHPTHYVTDFWSRLLSLIIAGVFLLFFVKWMIYVEVEKATESIKKAVESEIMRAKK